MAGIIAASTSLFLSTPPSRVATVNGLSVGDYVDGFYPRHPRGWRLQLWSSYDAWEMVSIHATLAGGDGLATGFEICTFVFLSTPPSRVATLFAQPARRETLRFYPRHPRGWRLSLGDIITCNVSVSIHATLAGGDGRQDSYARATSDGFYPRHPRGWRLSKFSPRSVSGHVSIHATLAGGDQ